MTAGRPATHEIGDDAGLRLIARYGGAEHWLAVLVTTRRDGEPNVSVVNAGIVDHPVSGRPVVGFVSRARTAKLANLRRHPNATLVFRAGWDWIAVSGPTELSGPHDAEGLPMSSTARAQLFRDIYHAAGGRHPDLDEYDRTMAAEGRTAVLLHPERYSSNPPGTDHVEHL